MGIVQQVEACPVCLGRDFHPIFDKKYPAATLVVSRCRTCTVSFSSTRFTDEYIKETFYSSNYQEDVIGFGSDYERTADRFFRGIVDKVGRVKPKGRWLDVGCGRGYLLKIAAQNGFSGTGVEMHADFIDVPGVDFHEGDLLSVDLPQGTYDVVSTVNVLDHLGEPRAFLQRVHALLKPGGVFFIHLQNERYFGSKLFGRLSGYCPNVHLVNYGQDNIGQILSRFGFSQCTFLPPRFKQNPDWKKMALMRGLEEFNEVASRFGTGLWITMQVMVRK